MNNPIEIEIDQILLDGFDHIPTTVLKSSIEHHLSLLLSANKTIGKISQSQDHDILQGGTMTVAKNSHSKQLGESMAKSIHEGLNNLTSPYPTR